MPILNLVHINIHVADLEQSIAFYAKLGFKVMFELSRHQADELVHVQTGDGIDYGGGLVKGAVISLGDDPRCATKLELIEYVAPATAPQPRKPSHQAGVHRLAMRVKDLDGTLAEFRARGVAITDQPHEIRTMGGRQRFVLFSDPDGTLLELIELLPL
jgi:catechol 2,3-dioxygenase-like lactoylglutathione lyase family enzyme